MKTLLFYILLMVGLFISSCSTKVPSLSNPEMGVAAMPVQVENRSSYNISRYYKLFCAETQDPIIKIYPKNGQKFAFSKELSPGIYSITQVTSILDTREKNVSSTTHKDRIDINTIHLEIYPGAISLVDSKMIVNQINTGHNSWSVRWKIDRLTEDEKKELIDEISKFQNSDQWEIVSN